MSGAFPQASEDKTLFMVVGGGALGLGLAWVLAQQGDPTGGFLPTFLLTRRDLGIGVEGLDERRHFICLAG